MPHRLTWVLACAATAVLASGERAPVRASARAVTRTVYVSAVGKDGTPVTDMQASDFEVKEGGKVQKIAVKPATAPLRVAILVADWGTGAFQAGMAQFMNTLLGHAEFKLVSLLPQPFDVLDYASDPSALSDGLGKLGARGHQEGAQLLDGIQREAKTVASDTRRPVILVLRIGNEAVSSTSGDTVRNAVRKSGAILEVVSFGVRQAARPTATGSDDVSTQMNRFSDDEARQSAFALAQVLGDGSKESGGRNEQVFSTSLIPTMESIADELLHQYEITYTLPAGQKPSEKLQVSSKRKDVTVRAPSRLPKEG